MVRIILRYASIQSRNMLLEDFPLPFLSKLVMKKSTLIYMHKLWRRMVKELKISVCYLMKCIYINVRSILEVKRLVPTRMENYIKELFIPWFYDNRIERLHPI